MARTDIQVRDRHGVFGAARVRRGSRVETTNGPVAHGIVLKIGRDRWGVGEDAALVRVGASPTAKWIHARDLISLDEEET